MNRFLDFGHIGPPLGMTFFFAFIKPTADSSLGMTVFGRSAPACKAFLQILWLGGLLVEGSRIKIGAVVLCVRCYEVRV